MASRIVNFTIGFALIAICALAGSTPSGLALSSSPNPSVSGQMVTVTVSPTPVSNPGINHIAQGPSGTVTFYDGSVVLGSATITYTLFDLGLQASLQTNQLSVGVHSLHAYYGGDDTYAPTTSASLTQIVTGVTQTITFAPLNNLPLGSGPITLMATASSGLPVTFTSNTPSVCAVSGNGVSLIAMGTCSITAAQPGNSIYAPAMSVTQSFIVETVLPVRISTAQLPGGNIGMQYLQALSATGGSPPYSNWVLCVGCALPAGLSLKPATGVISGVPTGTGTSFTVTVQDSSGATSAAVSLSISIGLPTTAINSGGIVSSATYQSGGPIAPGSIVSIFGQFPVTAASAQRPPLTTALSGLTVQFQNSGAATTPVSAPLFFVSPTQANVQVPWELTETTSAWTGQVQASATSSTSGAPVNILLAQFAPGVFTTSGSGTGSGAIADAQSGQLISPSNPAKSGVTYISIYCTGLGPVTNQPPTGAAATASPLSQTILSPTVTIGGVNANVLFSGLADGFVGLYQINVQVPSGVGVGPSIPLIVSIGGATAPTVTIAVQAGL